MASKNCREAKPAGKTALLVGCLEGESFLDRAVFKKRLGQKSLDKRRDKVLTNFCGLTINK